VFDKDMTGFIGVGQLKYILTNLGEKMSEEEVDELLKAVDTSSGQVNYIGRPYLPEEWDWPRSSADAFFQTDLVRTVLSN
jgi:hypothetical protein